MTIRIHNNVWSSKRCVVNWLLCGDLLFVDWNGYKGKAFLYLRKMSIAIRLADLLDIHTPFMRKNQSVSRMVTQLELYVINDSIGVIQCRHRINSLVERAYRYVLTNRIVWISSNCKLIRFRKFLLSTVRNIYYQQLIENFSYFCSICYVRERRNDAVNTSYGL